MRRLLSKPETATADDAPPSGTDAGGGHLIGDPGRAAAAAVAGGTASGSPEGTAGDADDAGPVAGASAVVEAATAEAAIAEVHGRFGAGATIVEARRVLRGGIGGFFAKEHVQLHVAADDAATAPNGAASTGQAATGAPATTVSPPPSQGDAHDDVTARAVALVAELSGTIGQPTAPATPVDRLLGDDEAGHAAAGRRDGEAGHAAAAASRVDDAVDFGTFLRSQLAHRSGEKAPGEVDRTWPRDVGQGPTVPAEAAPAPDGAVPADVVADNAPSEVAPMRWPGSRQPWSVYGGIAEPAPTVTAPAAAPAGVAPKGAPAAATRAAPTPCASSTPRTAGQGPDASNGAAVDAAGETTTGDGPAWSTTRLLHLGLPASLVHDLEVTDPDDDLSWVAALTDALRPICRPLPSGPAVLVGPDAPTLAEVVDLPVARSRTWLDALGANRWRHLVIGGRTWRAELTDEPLAVSWVRTEDLPDALRCATELGLVLGYGPQGGQLRRARPLDIALAVRELVEQP